MSVGQVAHLFGKTFLANLWNRINRRTAESPIQAKSSPRLLKVALCRGQERASHAGEDARNLEL